MVTKITTTTNEARALRLNVPFFNYNIYCKLGQVVFFQSWQLRIIAMSYGKNKHDPELKLI